MNGECMLKAVCDPEKQYYIENDNLCVCKSEYYEYNGFCINNDLRCDENRFLKPDPDTNTCVCIDRYHDENGICVKEGDVCDTTKFFMRDPNTGNCTCMNGYDENKDG